MRLRMPVLALAVSMFAQAPGIAAGPALTASPNPASPGQSVTIVWHFVANRIVLSGGRFGKGTDVSGRISVSDTPRKTTRYTAQAWYRPARAGALTRPNTAVVKARYEVVVRVETASTEPLKVYSGRQGWKVQYPTGWRIDDVRLPDPANNALVFLQKEQDSIERLAVSVLPAQDGGSEALMQKVRASTFTSYRQVQFVTETSTLHAGVPAAWMVFSGQDETHPGASTQSMVLAFVKGSRAYVVSARTKSSRFGARAPQLERIVRSFVPSAP